MDPLWQLASELSRGDLEQFFASGEFIYTDPFTPSPPPQNQAPYVPCGPREDFET